VGGVRRLGRRDIAALYQLRLAHLVIALDAVPPPRLDVGLDVDVLFERLAMAAGVRALSQSFERVQAQLAPARRLEPQLFADLPREAAELEGALGDAAGVGDPPSMT
jgi:hypothetical protein